jgi:hypothetical protein
MDGYHERNPETPFLKLRGGVFDIGISAKLPKL